MCNNIEFVKGYDIFLLKFLNYSKKNGHHVVNLPQIKRYAHRTYFAERKGFEPSIRFWRIHTFQACAFDHSATSLFQLSFIIKGLANNKKKWFDTIKSGYFIAFPRVKMFQTEF